MKAKFSGKQPVRRRAWRQLDQFFLSGGEIRLPDRRGWSCRAAQGNLDTKKKGRSAETVGEGLPGLRQPRGVASAGLEHARCGPGWHDLQIVQEPRGSSGIASWFPGLQSLARLPVRSRLQGSCFPLLPERQAAIGFVIADSTVFAPFSGPVSIGGGVTARRPGCPPGSRPLPSRCPRSQTGVLPPCSSSRWQRPLRLGRRLSAAAGTPADPDRVERVPLVVLRTDPFANPPTPA